MPIAIQAPRWFFDENSIGVAKALQYVRGDVTVRAEDGTIVRQDTRMALCRCGQSGRKPFCDNTHRRIGFRTGAPATASPDAADHD